MRPTALIRPGWDSVIICASGPSFTAEQAQDVIDARLASAARVIAVNDNYRRVPNADVLYACDRLWWDRHFDAVRASRFVGELWTQDDGSASKHGLRLIKQQQRLGLTNTDRLIYGGGNSGHQAIQLAYLWGATRIALVGFDMQANDDGTQHWFGEHPLAISRRLPTSPPHKLPFYVWIDRMTSMAPGLAAAGVSVVNCSPRSAIQCFPKVSLDVVLLEWDVVHNCNLSASA